MEADGYLTDLSGKKGGKSNSVQYALSVTKIINPTVLVESAELKPDRLEGVTRRSATANPSDFDFKPDDMCRGTEKTTENRTDKVLTEKRKELPPFFHQWLASEKRSQDDIDFFIAGNFDLFEEYDRTHGGGFS